MRWFRRAAALVRRCGRSAYNALVGLYFAERTPEVNGAFLSALGDDTIAERLAKPVDRTQQLAGNIWFYYGSRYGEYAGVTKQGNPEDFLPAMLEQSPGKRLRLPDCRGLLLRQRRHRPRHCRLRAHAGAGARQGRRARQPGFGILQTGRARRGHRSVEAGFLDAAQQVNRHARAGELLGGFFAHLRTPAQQKAVQRSKA